MEFEEALTNARWKILAALAEGDYAASEIAKKRGMSIPTISQQAKLLEAYGLIKKKKEGRKSPGKPRMIYTLNKEVAHLAVARHGFAGKQTVQLDEFHETILNIWFYGNREDHYCLQKFFWQNEELVEQCLGIAVVEKKEKEMHLLVIAEEEKLEQLRKKFSKVELTTPKGEKRQMISWTHSPQEIREGLAREEAYFQNLTRKQHIIFERKEVFKEVEEQGRET